MPADRTSYESVQTWVPQYASDVPAVNLDETDFVQERIISARNGKHTVVIQAK